MTISLSRRGFLAATAASAAAFRLPAPAWAQAAPFALTAGSRTIDVDGRAATVMGLTGPDGRPGLVLDPGQRFAVRLTNRLDEPTLIHWHGQIPPNAQDGVPDLPMPPLTPGESRDYDFDPLPGTHWMHSHIAVQELGMLAAPLVVRTAADAAADRQEVVMFLHDFAFESPAEVMAEITDAGMMTAMDHGGMAGMGGMSGMSGMAGMEGMGGAPKMEGMEGMTDMGAMMGDLNDYDFDAYLTNDRTLADPEIVTVAPRGRILLRVINAAAATTFWIETGAVAARLVAVDGHPVRPVPGRRFGAAMAQRLDIEIDLPDGAAHPVLALREGARERTGLILAPRGAAVDKIAALAPTAAPAFDLDLAQEHALAAVTPLARKAADRTLMAMLGGQMDPYVWTVDGRTFDQRMPIEVRSGERVELTFHNMSAMGHPMHLHGHVFQVVGVNGMRMAGAMRDTVYVPPRAAVTVAFDAGEAAGWMLHCHQMPHLAAGMATQLRVL